ncbi:MAG: DUF4147 domain-containing protein [Phycisphaeraceae bacterium]|nr:DUF4147 domain-containing protein [Phycisphaeraceae bacterium]
MPAFATQLHSFLACAQHTADSRRAIRPHLEQLVHQLPDSIPLLAIGKASLEMADEVLLAFGQRVSRGVVTCVPERLAALAPDRRAAFHAAGVDLLPADHPLATKRNVAAAERVRGFVKSLSPSDHLLVLISGGGSAHLTLPAPQLSLESLRDATRLLQRTGCDIRELNAVRKHCEQLKGGRLAAHCSAHDVRVLILSDVLGDPLDVISSGPFAPDPTTYSDALAVLEEANGWNRAPEIAKFLQRGERGELPETPKPGDPSLLYVATTIIGSNTQLVEALADHARSLDLEVAAKWHGVQGDARAVADRIAAFVREHKRMSAPEQPTRALIAGGEWTVNVGNATGSGGPSQELALALAIEFAGTTAAALVYSTDGVDGPTDAAGAIVDGSTLAATEAAGFDARNALANHDSRTLFAGIPATGAVHLRPGPTGTNVNHIAVVLF